MEKLPIDILENILYVLPLPTAQRVCTIVDFKHLMSSRLFLIRHMLRHRPYKGAVLLLIKHSPFETLRQVYDDLILSLDKQPGFKNGINFMWHEVILYIYKHKTPQTLEWFLSKIGQLPIRKWRNRRHASLVVLCDLILDIPPSEYMWSMFEQYMEREYGKLDVYITTLLDPLIITLINEHGSLPECLQRYIDHDVLACLLLARQNIDTANLMRYTLNNPVLISAIMKIVSNTLNINIIKHIDYFHITHTLLNSDPKTDQTWARTFMLFWEASRALTI